MDLHSPTSFLKPRNQNQNRSRRVSRNTAHSGQCGQGAANKHSDHLKRWFVQLTSEERGRVLSFEDKEGVQILRKMYDKKAEQGEGLFTCVNDPVISKFEDSEPFCFMKLTSLPSFCFYPESCLLSDRKLDSAIRLCDTREYLDTITVASELLEDANSFLKLMTTVTRGNFLSSPCRVSWDAPSKSWIWQNPKWFGDMGYYSLGTFLAHKLEKVMWMRYWDSHNLDPRLSPSGLSYTFPSYLEGLLSKTYLINFWRSRNPQERRKIVGSIGNIVQHILENPVDNYQKVSNSQNSKPPEIYTLETLFALSSQEKNLELLFSDSDLTKNEKTFIEILYFSPMNRAGSTIDMLLRRIGISIHGAYTEKLALDLIIGEEAEKIKASSSGDSKKKRKKKIHKQKRKEQVEKEMKKQEQKEKEEKEKKEKEKIALEQKRKAKEAQKFIISMVNDLVNKALEVAEKKNDSEKSPKKKSTKKKNKKGRSMSTTTKPSQIEDSIFKRAESCPTSPVNNRSRSVPRTPPSMESRRSSDDCNLENNRRRSQHLHNQIELVVRQTQIQLEKKFKPGVVSIIQKVQHVVTSIWPKATVGIYGSYATSLCIPTSDLDLVILDAKPTGSGYPLQVLSKALQQQKWLSTIQVIETAKVPVIKFLSVPERIPTDITFNDELSGTTYITSGLLLTHSGMAACEVVKGFIQKNDSLVPLVIVLKQFLYERGLNNTFTGGLSSYCLVLMVTSFLNIVYTGAENVRPPARKTKFNLGELLMSFFELYGKKFDYQLMGISVCSGGTHFLLKDSPFKFPSAPLVIIDPLNPTNNIAHHAFNFSSVKESFAEAHDKILRTPMDETMLTSVLKPKPELESIKLKPELESRVPPTPTNSPLRLRPTSPKCPPSFDGILCK